MVKQLGYVDTLIKKRKDGREWNINKEDKMNKKEKLRIRKKNEKIYKFKNDKKKNEE